MLERVVDVLVFLPGCLPILDLAKDGMNRLIKPTLNLIARLASLWREYESKVELPNETDPARGATGSPPIIDTLLGACCRSGNLRA